MRRIETHPSIGYFFAWSPDGKKMAAWETDGGWQRGVRIWDRNTGVPLRRIENAGMSPAWSPSGSSLAVLFIIIEFRFLTAIAGNDCAPGVPLLFHTSHLFGPPTENGSPPDASTTRRCGCGMRHRESNSIRSTQTIASGWRSRPMAKALLRERGVIRGRGT